MSVYYISMIIAIFSGAAYHICQKYMPSDINPLVALSVTYATAFALSILISFIYPSKTGFVDSIRGVNWASFVLGLSIVGLEAGFLLVYRSGWNLSVASLVGNVTTSLLLVPVGLLVFKEVITMKNALGIVLSLVGIILISQK
jgi:drug/metabolite transporter (DMT)-like permease